MTAGHILRAPRVTARVAILHEEGGAWVDADHGKGSQLKAAGEDEAEGAGPPRPP